MDTTLTTSENILNCARTLIVNGGYSGFSYADIADIVGIKKASIHHHFPTKADLVRTLVSQYRQQAEAAIAHMDQEITDPVEQLKAYTGYWNKCIADMSTPICVCALLASQLPMLPDEVASEVRAHFKMFAKWLASVMKRGAKQGTIHLSSSADAEGETFLATVHGAMLSARATGEPAVFKFITTTLLHRLTATA